MNLSQYVGISYEVKNCLEIIQFFYKQEFDIEIRNFFDGPMPDPEKVEALIVSNKGTFVKVQDPMYGDILTVNLRGLTCHLGVYVGQKKFLHSRKEVGSCIEPLKKYQRLVEGFYRHQELA